MRTLVHMNKFLLIIFLQGIINARDTTFYIFYVIIVIFAIGITLFSLMFEIDITFVLH